MPRLALPSLVLGKGGGGHNGALYSPLTPRRSCRGVKGEGYVTGGASHPPAPLALHASRPSPIKRAGHHQRNAALRPFPHKGGRGWGMGGFSPGGACSAPTKSPVCSAQPAKNMSCLFASRLQLQM